MNSSETEPKLTARKKQALATREKIYNTAFRLMTERGFDNITVEEICSQSGVAKGSFYHYFNNKDDIVIETYKIIDQQYSSEMYDLPADMHSIEKIIATVGFQAKYAKTKGMPFTRQIYKSQLESGADFFIPEERPYFKILRIIVEEGLEKGEIRDIVPAIELTRWIISFSRGITYDWCLHSGNYDIEVIMERAFRIILSKFKSRKKVKTGK